MAVSGGSFVWLLSLPYDLSVEKGADVSRNKANAWERGYSRCGEIDDHDVGMDTTCGVHAHVVVINFATA